MFSDNIGRKGCGVAEGDGVQNWQRKGMQCFCEITNLRSVNKKSNLIWEDKAMLVNFLETMVQSRRRVYAATLLFILLAFSLDPRSHDE